MKRDSHPFSLRQLQYAVAVAETLSFRQAAEACHVSQPALSEQLAQLESMIGVRLFERDRRRVLITSAGRALIGRMEQVLAEADDLSEEIERAGDPLAGTLRIGVIPTISPYLLPAITPALRTAFPQLAIVWVEDRTTTLSHSLDRGELDAAIVALEAELGDFDQEVVARDPFVLATSPQHALGRRKSPAKQADLEDVSVLLLDDGHCFRDQALAICSKAGARELEFRATSLSTLAQMVSGGAGVTLLPALAVLTETRRADLHVRPFARPAPYRTIAIVFRKRSPLAASLREVTKVVRDAYPKP